jgi:hypothetical protein
MMHIANHAHFSSYGASLIKHSLLQRVTWISKVHEAFLWGLKFSIDQLKNATIVSLHAFRSIPVSLPVCSRSAPSSIDMLVMR